jgi:hypothetical protein
MKSWAIAVRKTSIHSTRVKIIHPWVTLKTTNRSWSNIYFYWIENHGRKAVWNKNLSSCLMLQSCSTRSTRSTKREVRFMDGFLCDSYQCCNCLLVLVLSLLIPTSSWPSQETQYIIHPWHCIESPYECHMSSLVNFQEFPNLRIDLWPEVVDIGNVS